MPKSGNAIFPLIPKTALLPMATNGANAPSLRWFHRGEYRNPEHRYEVHLPDGVAAICPSRGRVPSRTIHSSSLLICLICYLLCFFGTTGLPVSRSITFPLAETAMSVASRFWRVSPFFALVTQYVVVRRYPGGRDWKNSHAALLA
jgi:hypothetical protein